MKPLTKVAKSQAAPFNKDTKNGERLKHLQRCPSDGLMWTFSFRFFRQIENFGLDSEEISDRWLLSVMERLQDLSTHKIDDVIKDQRAAEGYRYHPINWSQKNIPIQPHELDWIHKDYLENPTEFPLMQLMISRSLGRLVGFLDERNVFQIVLLDPLHNIQPSKDFGYAVDKCSPLACQYTWLHDRVSDAVALCTDHKCSAVEDIRTALSRHKLVDGYNVLMLRLTDSQIVDDAEDLVRRGAAESYAAIFEHGIASLLVEK